MADAVASSPNPVVAAAPNADAAAEHKYQFNVSMSCGGCSGAIDRVLKRMEANGAGIKSYDVSLDSQTVTVVAEDKLPYEQVLRTIAKTGKKVNSGEADGVAQSVEVPAE